MSVILKVGTYSHPGPPNTHCPCCGEKFVEIYCNSYDPVVPPEKMYEGLVDELDWHEVNLNSQYGKYNNLINMREMELI